MKPRTTAIQRRLADPAWQPFLTTPPYPDYTSGGNGVTGSTTGILKLYFGKDDVPFTVTSTSKEAKEKTRNYKSFSEYAKDMVDVRIYQGLHFRFADEASREQGEKVAPKSSRTSVPRSDLARCPPVRAHLTAWSGLLTEAASWC